MEHHLTVKEATTFTGKSESTIKRLIREITGDPNHVDRILILPDHAELESRRTAGEPYVWKVAETLLRSRFPTDAESSSNDSGDQRTASSGRSVGSSDRIVAVLEKSISVLESELAAKNNQIAQFQERQREQNLLLKNMQEQLILASPSRSTPDADAVLETEAEAAMATDTSVTPREGRRQSIWTREFRLFGSRRS